MPFTFQGVTFDSVPNHKMTPAEMDEVERITGLTYEKIKRDSQRCVCGHPVAAHLRYDKKSRPTDDRSCGEVTGCDCETFVSNVKSIVNYAWLYIAAKRAGVQVTFDEVSNTPQDQWSYTGDAAATPDPTNPPQGE